MTFLKYTLELCYWGLEATLALIPDNTICPLTHLATTCHMNNRQILLSTTSLGISNFYEKEGDPCSFLERDFTERHIEGFIEGDLKQPTARGLW